jgi:hypothetical protein
MMMIGNGTENFDLIKKGFICYGAWIFILVNQQSLRDIRYESYITGIPLQRSAWEHCGMDMRTHSLCSRNYL